MSAYECRVVSGSGSAAAHMADMLNAWAAQQGIELAPGTFNMCADRYVMVVTGQRNDPLDEKKKLGPSNQAAKDGYAPRLYPVTLNGSVDAWLFRWSEPPELSVFCDPDPDVCASRGRYCEIVAEVNLREEFGAEDGDTVMMDMAIA